MAGGAENKTRFVGVRLGEEEFASMERRRAEMSAGSPVDLSTSDYLRMLLTADAAREPGEAPDSVGCDALFWHNTVLQLRRVGTNLNQAVAGVNAALLDLRLHGGEGSEEVGRLETRLGTLRSAAAGTLEEMSRIADACAEVHDRAGVRVPRAFARSLMRQAAKVAPSPEEAEEYARRWAD